MDKEDSNDAIGDGVGNGGSEAHWQVPVEEEPPPADSETVTVTSHHPPSSTTSTMQTVAADAQPVAGMGRTLLEKIGWKEGQSLGKHGTGRLEPVEVDLLPERLGLGAADDGDSTEGGKAGEAKPYERKHHTDVDIHRFVPHIMEPDRLEGIACPSGTLPLGASDCEIHISEELGVDYDLFGSKDDVDKLFAAKSRFDRIDRMTFTKARSLANPYEKIGKAVFINRAALKMAELDHYFDLLRPVDPQQSQLLFADICAGPGGFTEYIMWRKKMEGAKGWGFTLRGEDDFKLTKFHPEAPFGNFETCYGVDQTGNIYVSENIRDFQRTVLEKAADGLDFLCADGGFSVDGDENFQEEHLKQLVLCQFLTALCVLRKGGNFVCKLFDTFTPFTAGLVYILYSHFESICILKPFTSRPANSERYIIARKLKRFQPPIIDFLFQVNDTLNELNEATSKEKSMVPKQRKKEDVVAVLSVEVILKDEGFVSYLKRQARDHADSQLFALDMIFKYIEDQYLSSSDQADVRKRCLTEWKLPLEERKSAPKHPSYPNPVVIPKRDFLNNDTIPRPSKEAQLEEARNRYQPFGSSSLASPPPPGLRPFPSHAPPSHRPPSRPLKPVATTPVLSSSSSASLSSSSSSSAVSSSVSPVSSEFDVISQVLSGGVGFYLSAATVATTNGLAQKKKTTTSTAATSPSISTTKPSSTTMTKPPSSTTKTTTKTSTSPPLAAKGGGSSTGAAPKPAAETVRTKPAASPLTKIAASFGMRLPSASSPRTTTAKPKESPASSQPEAPKSLTISLKTTTDSDAKSKVPIRLTLPSPKSPDRDERERESNGHGSLRLVLPSPEQPVAKKLKLSLPSPSQVESESRSS